MKSLYVEISKGRLPTFSQYELESIYKGLNITTKKTGKINS